MKALAEIGWSVRGVVETSVACVVEGKEIKETVVIVEREITQSPFFRPSEYRKGVQLINLNTIGVDDG